MLKFLWLVFTLLLCTTAGCGPGGVAPEDVYDPQELQGSVDTSLSRNQQAKQQALAEVLGYLLEGIDFDALPEYAPGVRFQESPEDFLLLSDGGGTIGLARWDFNGPPTGNDVPVVLFLSEDSSGRNERRVQRVYTVTGSGDRVKIGRKEGAAKK